MPKKDNRTMPASYAACVLADCPQGQQCLRRKVYANFTPQADHFNVVNPERCTRSAECPYFCDAAPVRYARGFKGMRGKMLPGQYDVFRSMLIATFSRNPFYERQRGDYGMSPREQAVVREILQKAGANADLEFDAYEEQYDWDD